MKKVNERFLKAREMLNLTQQDVAEGAGVLQQTVHKIEAGIIKSPRNINKYSKILNVTPEWLLFGKNPPLWAAAAIPENHAPLLEGNEIKEWWENGFVNIDLSEEKRWFVPSPVVEQPHRKNIAAMKVKGDSMVASSEGKISFTPGTILFIEKRENCESGDYIIVQKIGETEPIFRQAVIDGEHLFLSAANARYPYQKLDDDFLILGVVIARLDILI